MPAPASAREKPAAAVQESPPSLLRHMGLVVSELKARPRPVRSTPLARQAAATLPMRPEARDSGDDCHAETDWQLWPPLNAPLSKHVYGVPMSSEPGGHANEHVECRGTLMQFALP